MIYCTSMVFSVVNFFFRAQLLILTSFFLFGLSIGQMLLTSSWQLSILFCGLAPTRSYSSPNADSVQFEKEGQVTLCVSHQTSESTLPSRYGNMALISARVPESGRSLNEFMVNLVYIATKRTAWAMQRPCLGGRGNRIKFV